MVNEIPTPAPNLSAIRSPKDAFVVKSTIFSLPTMSLATEPTEPRLSTNPNLIAEFPSQNKPENIDSSVERRSPLPFFTTAIN